MDIFFYIFICYNRDPVDALTPFHSKRLIYFLFRDYFQTPFYSNEKLLDITKSSDLFCKSLKTIWTA